MQLATGCYWVDPPWHRFLWIAANELPLVDELIPFLLARSGRALDEFGQWVASRQPLDWVLSMLVLARRQLTSGQADDARIDACSELATLERWLDQAVTARTAAEALR